MIAEKAWYRSRRPMRENPALARMLARLWHHYMNAAQPIFAWRTRKRGGQQIEWRSLNSVRPGMQTARSSSSDEKMEIQQRPPTGIMQETRNQWPLMTAYERFEHIVAFLLGAIIAVIIVIALIQIFVRVLPLLLAGGLDPLDHEVFQMLFGTIMTLLIALEFKHSIIRVALRRDSIVQVKTVVLIALLALSRKFVILDINVTDASTIAALSGATLVLGIVYWLLRERDDRSAALHGAEPGTE